MTFDSAAFDGTTFDAQAATSTAIRYGWVQKLKSGSWSAADTISGSVWTQKQQGKPTW
jgi:hypothetical protein